MRRYLIHCKAANGRNVGALLDVPGDWTSDDYGAVQEAFAKLYGQPAEKYALMICLHMTDRTPNGIYYDWGLAGPNGASFLLIRLPENTRSQITAAANHIRRSRDVVHLSKLIIHTLVDFDPTPHVGQLATH